MAKGVTFEIEGAADLSKKLAKLAEVLPAEVGKALRQEAEIEMTEAKRRTPVLTGNLRSSGHVVGPDKKSNDVEVSLRFGGPAAPYAIYVHENLEAFHKVGQAKFLESTLMESLPHLPARVAARMAQNEQIRDVVKFKKGAPSGGSKSNGGGGSQDGEGNP